MSVSRFLATCVIFCTCSAFSSLVLAESDNKLMFKLATEAGYIDNFLYQASNEQSTAFYTLSSDMAFSSKSQQSAFNINANIATHLFDNFDDDDHTDYTIIPKYQFKFSQNQRLHVSALWLNSYSYRGTSLSLGQADELTKGDTQETVGAMIGYEYGTLESQGKLNFDLTYHESEFTTRRTDTFRLDTEILTMKSSFDYLLSGKTFLAFDLDYKIIDYPNDPLISRDSISGLIGMRWYTTVISELNFLVGYQNLTFEDSRLIDDSAFKWRIDYTWRPSDFTTLHIVSNRKFDETYRLISSYRLAQTNQIDILHDFTESLSILFGVGINNDEFITPDSSKDEDYLFTTLEVNYLYSERLSFKLSYDYKTLDANYGDIDFAYNKIGLSVTLNL